MTEETREQVIALKQQIQREVPGAGSRIDMGKERFKDAVFLWKGPGNDRLIYEDGTTISRRYWGQPKPDLVRESGFIKAVQKAKSEGFVLHPIFRNNGYERYKKQHEEAKIKLSESQAVFQTSQPTMNELSPIRDFSPEPIMRSATQIMEPMRQESFGPSIYNEQRASEEIYKLNKMADKPYVIANTPRYNTKQYTDNQFNTWMKSQYAGIQGTERQIGVKPIGYRTQTSGNKKDKTNQLTPFEKNIQKQMDSLIKLKSPKAPKAQAPKAQAPKAQAPKKAAKRHNLTRKSSKTTRKSSEIKGMFDTDFINEESSKNENFPGDDFLWKIQKIFLMIG